MTRLRQGSRRCWQAKANLPIAGMNLRRLYGWQADFALEKIGKMLVEIVR